MIYKTDECTNISSVEFKPVFYRNVHTLSLLTYNRASVYNAYTEHTRSLISSILGKRQFIYCYYNTIFTNSKPRNFSIVIFQCNYGGSCTVFYYPDQPMHNIYVY
jgi:hypothetical protein